MRANIREAILCIASACDVRINNYMDTQAFISKSEAKKIVSDKNFSFGQRYFDLLPTAICGQSLSSFNVEVSSDVESCYQQRNRLIHKGDLIAPLIDMRLTDRFRIVTQWRLSAEKALVWVDSLPVR